MRKSARDLITSLIVVIVLGALVGFFGWATYGFKNVDRFKEWFGIAQTEPDKSVGGDEQDKGTAEVGARNGGVIHDSDDAEVTVAVLYCDKPQIYKARGTTGVSVRMYTYNATTSAQVRGSECLVQIAPVTFNESGYVIGDRIDVTTFSYGGFSGDHPTVSVNSYLLTQTKIRELFPSSFAGNRAAVFCVYAKSLSYGNFLSSDEVSQFIYFDPNLSNGSFVEDTVIAIPKPLKSNIKVDNAVVQDNVRSNFSFLFEFSVGQYLGNGSLTNPQIFCSVSDVRITNSSFTQDEENVYCDLTKLSFVDKVGNYALNIDNFTVTSKITSDIGESIVFFDKAIVLGSWGPELFGIVKLGTPKNVSYENCVLSWEGDELHIPDYAIFYGDNLLDKVENDGQNGNLFIDLNDYNLPVGEHTFRIRALGNVGTALSGTAEMTAYNASSNITQLVALTYYVGGDQITKLVPYGKSIGDYLYNVDVDGKVFGGWFKDDGYSVAVDSAEKLIGDTAVYARLSDVETVDRPLTWWEKNMWYILGPVIGIFAVSIIAVVIKVVRDRKAA